MLPENLLTRRAAILMRSFISGLMENWLFAPQSFDLKKESSRLRHDPAGDVSIVSDAARVDGHRLPLIIFQENSWTFSVSLFCLLQA